MATCWSIKLRRPTAHSRLWHDMTFLTFQAHRMFAIPLGKTNATSAKLEIRNCRGWFVMRSSHSNLHSKNQNCIAHWWELCEFFEHVVNMGICFLYLGHSFLRASWNFIRTTKAACFHSSCFNISLLSAIFSMLNRTPLELVPQTVGRDITPDPWHKHEAASMTTCIA